MSKITQLLSNKQTAKIIMFGTIWSYVAACNDESISNPIFVISSIFFGLFLIWIFSINLNTNKGNSLGNKTNVFEKIISIISCVAILLAFLGNETVKETLSKIGVYVLVLGLAVLAILPDRKSLATA